MPIQHTVKRTDWLAPKQKQTNKQKQKQKINPTQCKTSRHVSLTQIITPGRKTHRSQPVAGQVQRLHRGVLHHHLRQDGGRGLGHVVAAHVELDERRVLHQRPADSLPALVTQAVEAQVEVLEGAVLRQRVSDGLRAGRADLVVIEAQPHQLAVVVEELAHGARPAVADEVVGEVQLHQARVVQDVGDEHPHLVVVHLAAVEPEDLKSLAGRHALSQLQAVAGGELEEVPLEVHAAIADSVGQVQLLQLGQNPQHGAEVEVVALRLVPGLAAGVRVVVEVRAFRGLPHWREELADVDLLDEVRGQLQRLVQLRGVRGLRDEVLDDLLQVALEVHPLPAAAVGGHVADLPAGLATALPVALVVHQQRCHLQRQVRGDSAQNDGLVLGQEVVQHLGVVCRGGGRKTHTAESFVRLPVS